MKGEPSRETTFSEEAFRRFYEETVRGTLAIARRVCGSEADALEACQDAYIAVYRYWSSGRLSEPPRRLLLRAARRSAIDALRKRVRAGRTAAQGGRLSLAPGTVGGPLQRALARLRPQDAALVVLQAIVGMTYQELAETEGTSVSVVRSRLFRARRELARRYEEEGGEW